MRERERETAAVLEKTRASSEDVVVPRGNATRLEVICVARRDCCLYVLYIYIYIWTCILLYAFQLVSIRVRNKNKNKK